MSLKNITPLIALVSSLFSASLYSQSITILADEFDLDASAVPIRSNNAQLNTRSVETGTGTWAALGNVRFGSFGGDRTIYADSTSAQRATLPVSIAPGVDEITLNWSVSQADANWVGGGFHNGNQLDGISNDGQLWMNFNGSVVNFFQDGTASSSSFTAGTDFSLSGGNFQEMSLTYNVGDNTATGIVNGTTLFSGQSLGAFTPSIDSVIFEWNDPDSNQGDSIGSMEVVTAIPEPSAYALIIGGAFFAFCFFKRIRTLE